MYAAKTKASIVRESHSFNLIFPPVKADNFFPQDTGASNEQTEQ